MPRVREFKTSFTSGEVDPLLQGRVDIKHYFNGAQRMRNVVTLAQGGWRPRDGLKYRDTVPEIPPGDGGGVSNTRLVPFQFSTVQRYMFLVYHKKVAIYKLGVLQATITIPHSSSELGELNWTQNLDSLLLFHPDHPTQWIQRQGSDTSWAVQDWPYENIPTFSFGLVTTGTVTPSTAAVGSATFTSSAAEFTSSMVGWGIRGNDGYAVITAFTNTSTVTAEIKLEFKDTTAIPAGEWTLEEPQWSATRGYPGCGTFFQGRLWLAGSRDRPQTVWSSRSGAVFDFDNSTTDDDFGIEATADTDDVSAMYNVYAGRHLQFLSSSGEFYVPISDEEAVTPKNMVLRRTTRRGSKPGIRVFEIDGATIFVEAEDKSGRSRALRELIFVDADQAYQANPVSLLASHLIRNPVAVGFRQSSRTDEPDYLLLVGDDGTLTFFCTLRQQEVNAFTLALTDGLFKDVGVDYRDMYAVVERVVDGSTVRYLEVFDDTLKVDAAVQETGLVSDVSSLNSGIDHLEGRECDLLLDGIPQPRVTVTSGAVTFERAATTSYQIGLPWPDASEDNRGLRYWVKTLPPEVQLPDGTMVGQKRRVTQVNVRLNSTTGLVVNGNRIPFRNFGSDLLDQAITPFTGLKVMRGFLGWDYEGVIEMYDTSPTDVICLGVGYKVSV